MDFNRTLAGPLLPPLHRLVEWFCSDDMYWSPWPAHVGGWWQRAKDRDNVLFVHFEEMSRDFSAVRVRVARFLGVDLTAAEAARVDARCTLAFMQEHESDFEMARPTMFSVRGGTFLRDGGARRLEKLPKAARSRIRDYCRRGLAATAYPVARFYPDRAPAASPGGQPTAPTR